MPCHYLSGGPRSTGVGSPPHPFTSPSASSGSVRLAEECLSRNDHIAHRAQESEISPKQATTRLNRPKKLRRGTRRFQTPARQLSRDPSRRKDLTSASSAQSHADGSLGIAPVSIMPLSRLRGRFGSCEPRISCTPLGPRAEDRTRAGGRRFRGRRRKCRPARPSGTAECRTT
jgi:hypothetical protein